MARTFRVRCPACGPQRVEATQLRLISGVSVRSSRGTGSRYVFSCPSCGMRVRLPAGRDIVAILREAGVPMLGVYRGDRAG